MSAPTNMAGRLKLLDRKLWPAHRVELTPEMAADLRANRLILADVGSAGGVEELWLGLEDYIHFLTFDPNPRPHPTGDYSQSTNFPVGLWSSPGQMELNLTAHPDSSSLLPINTSLFADFVAKSGMEVVGKATITVDSLDRLLADKPALSPDFLKIDVEGGELEVLKGANQALSTTVMGLKVETAFVELQVGRPLLWQIDEFLRDRGFVLFNVGRNYWIRDNRIYGYSSQPQLIWGDATYFLGREHFLKRLSAINPGHRKNILTKFVVLLLRYGVHDYAWDLIDGSATAGLIPAADAQALKAVVEKSLDRSIWYFISRSVGLLFSLAILVVSLPSAGARKRAKFYVKQRAWRLFHDLTRLAVLGGRGHNACLEDPFV
jgi:FkbM family methyltransferase